MNVILLTGTIEPEYACGRAAAICVGSKNYQKSLEAAVKGGHLSVLEHATLMFEVDGLSRMALLQLTRHRLASYSVQSGRYCVEDNVLAHTYRPECLAPYREDIDQILAQVDDLYHRMVEAGIPQESARAILPQGQKVNLVLSMNVRELLHFFELRCCNRAQDEIRELADRMMAICRHEFPALFTAEICGAHCQRGLPCPEGKRCCGHPRALNEEGSV